MSPILTRPVREQLEHDRVIRLLQARYKRKTEVIINPGSEQNQSVQVENLVLFPDVLIFAEGGKKLVGTVEVETGESVTSLEARAQWARFAKLRVPLHLYCRRRRSTPPGGCARSMTSSCRKSGPSRPPTTTRCASVWSSGRRMRPWSS